MITKLLGALTLSASLALTGLLPGGHGLLWLPVGIAALHDVFERQGDRRDGG